MDSTQRSLVIACSMAMFVMDLDFFAVQAALPATALDFGITTAALEWVISGYMIALASGLIVGGRLADLLGRRTWFFIGAGILGLASLVGGLAMSPEVLVLARVVQGAGGAILMPVSIAVVTNAFPAAQAQRALGLVFGIAATGQALGPFIGGAITDSLSWRWVSLINVPIILVIMLLARTSLLQSRDDSAPRLIDWPGLFLIIASVAAFTYGIDKAGQWGWRSRDTQALVLLGLTGFTLFLIVEHRTRYPLIDLGLFRIRGFSVMVLAGVIGNVAMTVTIFVAMIFLQDVQHFSPTEAGFAFLAFSGGATLAPQLLGRLERFADWAVMNLALLTGGLGAIGMALSTGDMTRFLVCSALAGFGSGLSWAFASVATQAVVPAEKAGGASGVVLTALIGFGGVGVSVASSYLAMGSEGLQSEAMGPLIGNVLMIVGLISVLFVPVVTLLGRRRPGELDGIEGPPAC